ncbi:hypothetical protein AgCh_020292 [Apium graveolens]
MKKCELCSSIARMFCESDQASLCWSCDAKVHSANFLVAKHSRTLLCQTCQSLTPWTGSGPKLGHTLSVCESCCVHGDSTHNNHVDDDDDEEDEEDENEEDDDTDEEQEEDDGENQVVPLSSSSLAPPQITSSSSSEESSVRLSSGAQSSRQPRFSIPWRRNQ